MRRLGGCVLCAGMLLAAGAQASAAAPQPGTPEYLERDQRNMADAYGRQTAKGGQLDNPNYLPALVGEGTATGLQQLADQAAQPNRPALTPGNVFPGWNMGNPLRAGWAGTRGMAQRVSWTNRYGALIRGTVHAPLPRARDPYTGKRLRGPFPGVVITTGSVQGSERMYTWLAQDLAERGYVVLTYDVQGQGTSETFPHENEQFSALPFCNPFSEPKDQEAFGCPGVPAQQPSNFVHGTTDALSYFLSTPRRRYRGAFNPYWGLFDRRKDRRTATRGRTTRVAIVGHSLGAFAISYVQGVDRRVQTAVALDKLSGSEGGGTRGAETPPVKPRVPALAVQSEYGFTVNPYFLNHGSSLTPSPAPPDRAPDPRRELKTGFDAWAKAKRDVMTIVPRASTHLEYTDISYALPASRFGEALTSVYVQRWLDRYLKHNRRRGKPNQLLARRFRYLEPVGQGKWEPITLQRAPMLSFYHCSGYSLRKAGSRRRVTRTDIGGVGGC